MSAAINPLLCFAQEDPVKILVRQIGASSYSYEVINHSTEAIKSFAIGYNYHRKGYESELLTEPTAVKSPAGWEGFTVLAEETEYFHISWFVLADAFLLQPGSSVDGFIVHLSQSDNLMKTATFMAIYVNATVISGKVQVDTLR
jgi:hypothetical protein